MKASEIQWEVVKAEDRLTSGIASVDSSHINDLAEKTGLVFGGISLETVDVTTVSDEFQRVAVCRVSLDMALPDKIRG